MSYPSNRIDQLERLAQLHQSGVLTAVELAIEKDRLLNAASSPTAKAGSPDIPFQAMSDAITSRLGLERLESFSIKSFLSDAFRHHDPNEVESLFSVGSLATTPELSPSMANMPNPWVFFRVFVGVVAVYGLLFFTWVAFRNMFVLPALIVVGSFAVPIATLILFFELNTPRNVSIVRVIQLFTLGGATALIFSLFLFDVLPFLGVFGDSSAGIVEEVGKLAAVLFAFRYLPMDRYPYLSNAILFGAAVGAGFAATESAGYAFVAAFDGEESMTDSILMRGALAPFMHIIWTAITTAAYWRVKPEIERLSDLLSRPKFLYLMIFAMALHFIWNSPFEPPLMSKYIALGFAGWVVVFSLIQTALNEIGRLAEPGRVSARATNNNLVENTA